VGEASIGAVKERALASMLSYWNRRTSSRTIMQTEQRAEREAVSAWERISRRSSGGKEGKALLLAGMM
jgi:hypothetical protein